MKHGSLFSGIGGFDLAAQWAGWENIFHCEWNPFGQKILHHYWPEAESFNDITKTDFTKYANEIDILTGGFPCQPYSSAGKRKGKEDERHLWPEMLRAIREIQPRWVVGENVRGLTNWNGGMVFDEVQADLEAEGYEIIPFLLPACAVNAPHRRDRIWFIAYSNDTGNAALRSGFNENGQTQGIERQQPQFELSRPCDEGNATDTDSNGQHQCNSQHEINTSKGRINALSNAKQGNGNGNATNTDSTPTKYKIQTGRNLFASKTYNGNDTDTDIWKCEKRLWERKQENSKKTTTRMHNRFARFSYNGSNTWENFPTQSPICGGNDGLPAELDGITFSKWRNESIKGYGNAIVPQVAYQIFNAINQYEYNHR
jgi:DNA (cytosine-5)-methyltransferase 1